MLLSYINNTKITLDFHFGSHISAGAKHFIVIIFLGYIAIWYAVNIFFFILMVKDCTNDMVKTVTLYIQ